MNCKVYAGFIDFEKVHECVDREALWQILRMYGVNGKLLIGNKSYVGSRAFFILFISVSKNVAFALKPAKRSLEKL